MSRSKRESSLGDRVVLEGRSYNVNWSERKGKDHQAEVTPRDKNPGDRARHRGTSSRPVQEEGTPCAYGHGAVGRKEVMDQCGERYRMAAEIHGPLSY